MVIISTITKTFLEKYNIAINREYKSISKKEQDNIHCKGFQDV